MNSFKFVYRVDMQRWLDLGWVIDDEDNGNEARSDYNPVVVLWWKHDRKQEIPDESMA